MQKLKTLALIPARGGSKGLPGKNIRPFAGKPLLAWSIEQALASKSVDRVAVSTDDQEIANVALKYGAEVPALRPAEFSTDQSPTIDAVLHLLETYEEKHQITFENVALLEPTSPLRAPSDIDRAIAHFQKSYESYDCLVSVGKVALENPYIMQTIENGYLKSFMGAAKPPRRQEAPDVFFPYGVIYLSKVSVLQTKRTFFTERSLPFEIQRWQNYEIDDACDFQVCESLMKSILEGRSL